MPWVKTSDALPADDELVHIYDPESRRMETGRHVGGSCYIEDSRDGRLTSAAWVTHWAPILDSEINDDSDDD